MDFNELSEKFEDEFLQFDMIEAKRSRRPDLHAFLLLDELVPGDRDIIGAAHHDEFFIDVDCDELIKVLTVAHWIELTRCGVRYDRENDSLAMFA